MGRSYSSIPGASRFSKSKLDQVYKRGLGAYYSSGSRPGVTAHRGLWVAFEVSLLARAAHVKLTLTC